MKYKYDFLIYVNLRYRFLIGFVFWYSLNLSVILSLYSSFPFFLSLKRSCSNLRRILSITGTTFRDCLERIKLLLVLSECVEKFILPLVPRSKDDQVGTEDISAFFMPKQNNISCRDMVRMSSTNIWTLWLERNTWLLYSGHWCFRNWQMLICLKVLLTCQKLINLVLTVRKDF